MLSKGRTSLINVVGTGFNRHVDGLDDDICSMLNNKLLWHYGELSCNDVHNILIFYIEV